MIIPSFSSCEEEGESSCCLGKDNKKIIEAFKDKVPTIVETTSMEEAVRSAYYLAKKGETVLLSPAVQVSTCSTIMRTGDGSLNRQ